MRIDSLITYARDIGYAKGMLRMLEEDEETETR